MKLVNPKIQTTLTAVKSIFINPNHYTYVLQKADGHISLYDQMTMRQVGKTKIGLMDDIKMVAFTDNFNYFLSYIQIKPYFSSVLAHIVVCNLEKDDKIHHKKHLIRVNGKPAKINLKCIAYHQPILNENAEKSGYIIGLGSQNFHFINMQGEIMNEINLNHLNLINAFYLQEQEWLLFSKNDLLWSDVNQFEVNIKQKVTIIYEISDVFLDNSLKKQFVGVLTVSNIVFILQRYNNIWQTRFNFTIPLLSISKLCFLYPGIDTHNLNKYKDKLFIIFDGIENSENKQRKLSWQPSSAKQQQIVQVNQVLIAKRYISSKFTYVFEYSLLQIRQRQHTIKPKQKLYFADNSQQRRFIWTNQHDFNSILVLDGENNIKVINLICLVSGQYVGVQWVCLGFKFEGTKTSVQLEQRESQYDNIQRKKVTAEDLQDWSYSLFSKKQFTSKSLVRLNSLSF